MDIMVNAKKRKVAHQAIIVWLELISGVPPITWVQKKYYT